MTEIKVKLYASLADYLPPGAKEHTAPLAVEDGTTIFAALSHFKVPEEKCHLVLLNGIFVPPSQRRKTVLSEGDTVAVWPPVAGG